MAPSSTSQSSEARYEADGESSSLPSNGSDIVAGTSEILSSQLNFDWPLELGDEATDVGRSNGMLQHEGPHSSWWIDQGENMTTALDAVADSTLHSERSVYQDSDQHLLKGLNIRECRPASLPHLTIHPHPNGMASANLSPEMCLPLQGAQQLYARPSSVEHDLALNGTRFTPVGHEIGSTETRRPPVQPGYQGAIPGSIHRHQEVIGLTSAHVVAYSFEEMNNSRGRREHDGQTFTASVGHQGRILRAFPGDPWTSEQALSQRLSPEEYCKPPKPMGGFRFSVGMSSSVDSSMSTTDGRDQYTSSSSLAEMPPDMCGSMSTVRDLPNTSEYVSPRDHGAALTHGSLLRGTNGPDRGQAGEERPMLMNYLHNDSAQGHAQVRPFWSSFRGCTVTQYQYPIFLPVPAQRSDTVPTSPSASAVSVTSSTPDPLSCDTCGIRYAGGYRKGNLARHKRQKHGDKEQVWECEELACKKVYKRQDARLKHYRTRHPHLARRG